MTSDPIAGCRSQSNGSRGFYAFALSVLNGLQLKDRLPIEMGKTDCQRDQFLTQVIRAEVSGPVVEIVDLSCEFFSPPPGVPISVP
jgi:hypothetical protein